MVLLCVNWTNASLTVSVEDDIALRSSLHEITEKLGISRKPSEGFSLWLKDRFARDSKEKLDLHQTPRQLKLAQFATLYMEHDSATASTSKAEHVTFEAPTGAEIEDTQPSEAARIELHAVRAASGMQSLTLQDLVRGVVHNAREAGTLSYTELEEAEPELLEKVFCLLKLASTISNCAAQIRHLKVSRPIEASCLSPSARWQAAEQSELLLDLTGLTEEAHPTQAPPSQG